MSMMELSKVPAMVSADFDSLTLRQTIAGYLAGCGESSGLQPGSASMGPVVSQPRSRGVTGEESPHRALCPLARGERESARHCCSAAVDDHWLLPVLRRGAADSEVARSAYPPPETRLRVECGRARPQRAGHVLGPGWAVWRQGSCFGVSSRFERAANLRSSELGHRGSGIGAWPPDADHHQERRQSGDHPLSRRWSKALSLRFYLLFLSNRPTSATRRRPPLLPSSTGDTALGLDPNRLGASDDLAIGCGQSRTAVVLTPFRSDRPAHGDKGFPELRQTINLGR